MLYFLYGSSPYLELETEKQIEIILNKYPDIKLKYFDSSQKEEELFFESIQNNSIFMTMDCLILKRAEILKSSGIQKILKSLKDFDLSKKIILVLYNLPMQYNKVVAEYELTKTVLKNIEAIGTFIDCTQKEDNLILDYVKNKLDISDKDTKHLIELLGNDYYNIKNEVDKISSFLNGEKYSFDKIKNLISIDKEYSLKEVVENFFKTKNPLEILTFLEKNKDSSMGFIYFLSEELLTFLKLSSLIAEGKIHKGLNYNVFKELYSNFSTLFLGKNNKAQHSYVIYLKLNTYDETVFSEKFLKDKLRELLNMEYQIKSGEREIDSELSTYLLKFYA